jgi:ribonuclease HI
MSWTNIFIHPESFIYTNKEIIALKTENGNWVRKQFKKNKVWAAADQNGELMIQNNKVLIKYQLDQEHEYRVNADTIFEIQPKDQKHQKPTIQSKADNRPKKPKPERHKPEKPKEDTPEIIEEENAISIYTDGASSGNPGPSGIGVFMRYGKHEREISRYIGNSTNNIAELTAIETALKEVKRTDLPIRIYTDSSYACGLLINGWKAKKNILLTNSIRQLMTTFNDLKIIKVKGHSGLPGNEKADQLATAAIASQKNVS